MHEQKNVYSLRKLSVGLASVIVGTCFFISNGQNVKADTLNVGERQASTVIQQDSSKKQDSNEQNDQTNVSNSKTEQQQSTNERNDVENVDSNLNDTNKLDNADDSIKKSTDKTVVKPVESETNQKFDQVKDQFKQDTAKTKNVTSSVIEENDEGKTIQKADVSAKATTLNVTKTLKNLVNVKDITESKVVNKNLNGGFDEATWGKLDVNKWKGSVQGDYYQLTSYTGDANHVIVPNEADFEKAGISTSGKQVAVTNNFFKGISSYSHTSVASTKSLAFSKTAEKQVKAIGNDWTDAFSFYGFSKFNGENLDVSNVTNMSGMFRYCRNLSDISSLANWDTSNVTDMTNMFFNCDNLSDISSLAHWDTSKVISMVGMFDNCSNLSNISSLANWDTSNVTIMDNMFENCNNLSDISPLANWNTSNVYSMWYMFGMCNNLSDISPLAHWDTSKVTNMSYMFDGTALKKFTLTNWDFSNIDPSHASIFPDTNFEATLSDKTSKSLLDILSKLSDSAKENLKDKQNELKQAEQKYQYYLTDDGKKEYDGQIQDLQEQFNQYKQEIQQEINQYKLQAEYPLTSVFGNHSKITTPNRDLLIYLVGKLPVKSDTATRTIEITFPDGTKKTINQSVGYGKHAISGTADMATHKLDMGMPYELSKWELIKKEDGSYDLVKAHVDENGVASFDNVALPKVAGYKAVVTPAKQNAINPMAQMFMVSFVALPKQPNTEQSSTSSSSVTDKANNSHDLHDDSKKRNDQPIISNNETDHTINVSAQAVDPTVEPEKNNVASQNNSTTSAQTQQSSTNDAEQLENNYSDRVVNDQTDDFADSSREENYNSKAPEKASDWSKPKAGKITHVNSKTPQNGLNETVRSQSVATHPATTSVINNSKSDAKQLPQTNESDSFNYTALSLLLGLDVAMVTAYAEKKRKKY